jgi:hypothetical protein
MEDVGSDYAMLEVRPDASWEEIQRAYHDLVRVWHPDRFASDRRLQERAERKLQQIMMRIAGWRRSKPPERSGQMLPPSKTHPQLKRRSGSRTQHSRQFTRRRCPCQNLSHDGQFQGVALAEVGCGRRSRTGFVLWSSRRTAVL